jgi:hypothetical protein
LGQIFPSSQRMGHPPGALVHRSGVAILIVEHASKRVAAALGRPIKGPREDCEQRSLSVLLSRSAAPPLAVVPSLPGVTERANACGAAVAEMLHDVGPQRSCQYPASASSWNAMRAGEDLKVLF